MHDDLYSSFVDATSLILAKFCFDLVVKSHKIINPTIRREAEQNAFCDPIELKKFDFSQKPMEVPPIPFWVGGDDNYQILEFWPKIFGNDSLTKTFLFYDTY